MKRNHYKNTVRQGQSLIEIILVIGLMALILPSLYIGLSTGRQGKAQHQQRLQAVALLQATQESLRSVREKNWPAFAVNGVYHPIASGSGWILAWGADTINGITRQITISDVYRASGSGAIVSSSGSGTLDPSTKQADILISWTTPLPNTISSTIYLTRYLDNFTLLHTTIPDFSAGIVTGTTVVAQSGTSVPNDGQVELATGGSGHGGDWCAPSLGLPTLSFPQTTTTNAIYAIPGQVFIGIGDVSNKGYGESFANVAVTQSYPPTASTKYVYSSNPVYGTFGEPNYAYLAVDDTSKQVLILDTTVTPFTTIGSFTPPTTTRGSSVFVSGNAGYMTAGNKLYNFDLTSRSGVRPKLSATGVDLQGTGVKVVVVNNYAFVANSSTTNQLQIIDISNPASLHVVGQATVSNQIATDLAVNPSGTRAYLVTKYASGQKSFFIIDTTTKTGNQPVVGNYDTLGMSPNGVAIATGNKVIIVGFGGKQYQVLNISQESAPVSCGNLTIANGIYGVSTVLQPNGDAYAYIITGDSSGQFKMILGGNGTLFSNSGTFESKIFDAGYQIAFNRFVANIIRPSQTSLTLQVAAAQPVNGACTSASFSYLGPDKTSNTFFTPVGSTISAPIPFGTYNTNYLNPNQCFRYKLFFSTTDTTQTPIVTDMSVNYSP